MTAHQLKTDHLADPPSKAFGLDYEASLGKAACDFAASYKLIADDWQVFVVDTWLALTKGSTDRLHTVCVMSMPRQNGKGVCLEIRELVGAVAFGETIVHTAHEVKTAEKHIERLKYFFGDRHNDPKARFPDLNAKLKKIDNSKGQQKLIFHNGASIEIVARSKSSARGYTCDLLVIDEAQQLTDAALSALLGSAMAAAGGQPQVIYTGTPPGPEADGEVFARVRRGILDGTDEGCYIEWSPTFGLENDADLELDDLDVRDESTWGRCNPGIRAGRNNVKLIRAAVGQMSKADFAREILGWWSPEAAASPTITEKVWANLAVSKRRPVAEALRTLGVTFAIDGSRTAVSGALTWSDGRVHTELISDRLGPSEEGLESLARWILDRKGRYDRVVLAGKAGAPVLADLLKKGRFPMKKVVLASTPEYLAACATMLDRVKSGSLSHPVVPEGQTSVLDESVKRSYRFNRGREGGWGWASLEREGDQVPLESATLAVWGAANMRRRSGSGARRQGMLAA